MSRKQRDREDFMALAGPILEDPGFCRLKEYIQHGSVTTYDHCVDVAWTAFRMNRKLHIGADEADLVKACLLHDYYLYDWHTKGDHLHGFHHPSIAARHAGNDFRVNEEVAQAIRTHMWPLTLTSVPNGKIAWLLTAADKICSTRETVFRRGEEDKKDPV